MKVLLNLKSICLRVLEFSASLLAILALFPIFFLTALAVKTTSHGPIFYVSQRIGKSGLSFSIFKFRTMYIGSNQGGPITGPEDGRITRIGRILRNIKLDELPQLFNVLVGDMAIIGPRPESPEIVEKYYDSEMRKTLSVKPGLTGEGTLLYLQNFRETVSTEDPVSSYVSNILRRRLAADLHYINNRSLLGDFSIIVRTVTLVASRIFIRKNRE